MIDLLAGVLKIFGVVFLRFRPIPRVWAICLVGVNLLCLYFIKHIEAQVVLATTIVVVLIQGVIYQRTGFTRLLGITHVLWIPMFAWMATRLTNIADHPDLETWLTALLVTNAVSLGVDIGDVLRFVRGERKPHYCWS